MEIRQLESDDLEMLSSFIEDSYDDYPFAMWFESKPQKGEIERIFYNKVNGISSRFLTDLVAEDSGKIVGECEVVRTHGESGVVGIIVRKGYKRRGIGTMLLKDSIARSREIGIRRVSAEVMKSNGDALGFFVTNGFMPVNSSTIEKGKTVHESVLLEMRIR